MSSTLQGIMNIATQSVNNNQVALNVVSNNIANMNTRNYTKQRVEFAALPAYDCYNWCSVNGHLKIGHGAEIAAITNKREAWLDNYFRGQNSASSYYNQIGGMTDNIENLLNNELGENGLQKKLSDFFAASEALSSDPTNQAYKIAFVNAVQNVSDMLNSMSKTINGHIETAVGKYPDVDSFNSSTIKSKVDELDSKLAQLAEINKNITRNPDTGSVSNDLSDKQQALLDELSSMIPLTTKTNANGTVDVIIDGQAVVKGGEKCLDVKATLSNDANNPVKIQLLDKDGNVKSDDFSDSLGDCSITAILQAGKANSFGYKSVLNSLDKLASAFADEVNRIQSAVDANGDAPMYIGPNGTLVQSTTPMFVTKDGSGTFTAGNISVNAALLNDPSLVATARMNPNAADFDDRAVGNNSNMSLFNNLAKGKLVALSETTPPGEGLSITDYLSKLVAKVGSDIQGLKNAQSAQDAVTEQAIAQRDAMYGVDLNEELADLIRYQRSYEASARVFNAANEMMQVIVNLGK